METNSLVLLLFPALPLLGGVLLPLIGRDRPIAWRGWALIAPIAQLLLVGLMVGQPDSELNLRWLPDLGLALDLGLDGLSLAMVGLTALLTATAILSSRDQQPRPGLFFPLLLAVNLGLVGAFLARNALLFVLCFELILIPTTLLVAIWGGERRAGGAIRYLIYAAVSGITLLAAVLAFGLLNANGNSFSYADLAAADLSTNQQRLILALLLVAFGLKLPIVPLHGWQPFTYSEASTPVVVLLGGVVSKLGAYGLLRFAVGFLPEAWMAWAPWVAGAGAVTACYGALNAIAQKDMRRLVAYSSLGHMGLLLLALAAATPLSLQGAVALILAHGTILALLFMLVDLIDRKTGTTQIAELSGLLNPYRGLPFTLGLLLLALMASAGIPGQAGFVGELLVFEGSWSAFPWATLTCLAASGLTAVYAVRLFNRVGFGRLDNARADWQSTGWRERLPALLLSGLVVTAGLWPPLLLGWSEDSTARLALRAPSFGPLIAMASSTHSQELPS